MRNVRLPLFVTTKVTHPSALLPAEAVNLKAPTETASGMTASVLAHTDRKAAVRVLGDRIGIARRPTLAFPDDCCPLRRGIRIREPNLVVKARCSHCGDMLRLRGVRFGTLQRIRGQTLCRRLRPGDSAETCDRQTKAFHRSALYIRARQALFYRLLIIRERSRNHNLRSSDHFFPRAAAGGPGPRGPAGRPEQRPHPRGLPALGLERAFLTRSRP
jgi:hypothetical protein